MADTDDRRAREIELRDGEAPTETGERRMGLLMKYFVLKPSGTDAYARASRQAMRAYALAIRNENQEMALDLREWADREMAQDKADG